MRSVVGVVRIELWFVIIQSPCNVTWKVSVWIDRDIEGYVPYITIHHSSVPSYASPLFDRCNSITSHSARCLLRYHHLTANLTHCQPLVAASLLLANERFIPSWRIVNRVDHSIEDFSKWQISTRNAEDKETRGGPIQGTITWNCDEKKS